MRLLSHSLSPSGHREILKKSRTNPKVGLRLGRGVLLRGAAGDNACASAGLNDRQRGKKGTQGEALNLPLQIFVLCGEWVWKLKI